jgi:hypothetical protein
MYRTAVMCCLLSCFMVGCGSGSTGPQTYAVSGTVTFDGQPVKSGDILFEPEAKGESPDGGKITDGKFSFRAKQGKMKVKISASREVPGKTTKGAMGEEIVTKEDFIPERYNATTELSETVKTSGNTFTFALKGDEAPR